MTTAFTHTGLKTVLLLDELTQQNNLLLLSGMSIHHYLFIITHYTPAEVIHFSRSATNTFWRRSYHVRDGFKYTCNHDSSLHPDEMNVTIYRNAFAKKGKIYISPAYKEDFATTEWYDFWSYSAQLQANIDDNNRDIKKDITWSTTHALRPFLWNLSGAASVGILCSSWCRGRSCWFHLMVLTPLLMIWLVVVRTINDVDKALSVNVFLFRYEEGNVDRQRFVHLKPDNNQV